MMNNQTKHKAMNTSLYIKRLYVTALISVVAFTAVLAQDFTVDGLNYRVTSTENKEVQVISGEIREEIIIPETVTYDNVKYTVTRIADYAFSGRRDQSNFTRRYVIPGSVKSIGQYAFYDNYYLEEVVLNEGLETIGHSAFEYTSIKEIHIPSTVTYIDNYAFHNSETAYDIYCYARLPRVNEDPFYGCRSFSTLHVLAEDLASFQASDYWSQFKTIQTFEPAYLRIPQLSYDQDNYLMTMYAAEGTSIYYTDDNSEPTTSSTLYSAPFVFAKNATIKAIAKRAGMADSHVAVFKKDDLRVAEPTCAIDNETLQITFSISDIKDIEGFPETKIYYIIDGSGSWDYQTIAEGRTDWVLWDGNPIQLTTPQWVHTYAVREGWYDSYNHNRYDYVNDYYTNRPSCEWIKEKSKLHLYYIDADATVYYTLDGSDPTKDSYVYNPDDSIFVDHNLTVKWVAMRPHHFNSEIGTTVITDATSKFVKNGIAYRRIDNNVANEVEVTSKLNESSKYEGHIVIPEEIQFGTTTYTVTRIGDNAFNGCPKLTGVTIPPTVTNIGGGAFYNCDAMTQIDIPSNVEKIDNYAFSDCDILKDVVLHDGLREIGYRAFANDGALKQITLPETVESIGDEAFSSSGLNGTIVIPDAVTRISNNMFNSCQSLKAVVMGDGITSIGEGAFRYCYSLESVTFNSALTTVGYEAFYQCSSLLSIELKEGVKSIDTRAFYECGKLSTISLPTTLTSIGDYAFERCSSLPTIRIPENVKSLGRRAFQSCSALESAYLMPSTPPSLVSDDNGHAFYDQLTSMTLYVKSADKDAYEGNYLWSQIENIKALGSTPSAQPTFTLDRNSYELTISSRDANAAIYYTRDNSEPTEQSTRYTAPIAFMQNDTVKAIAVSDGLAPSQVSEFKKNDFMVPVPVPTMDENYVVTIDCETPQLAGFPETKIYYIINTDGYQWYETIAQGRNDWQLYEGPIQLSQPRYVHAYAVRDGWIDSERTIADYSSNYYTNTPWSEWVSDKNKLRLYNYDADATVYYTLDGSDPTENSAVYNPEDSIFIDHNLTVKWVAIRANHFNSAIGSCTITDVTSTFVVGDFSYRRIDGNPALEVEVTTNPVGKKYKGDLTVPDEFMHAGTTYKVTRIGENAFSECTELTSITLPSTITSIGTYAFYNANSLQKIEFTSPQISIDWGAFESCTQLKEVTFHGQLTRLEPRSFRYCYALESIVIPRGLSRIEGSSFYQCGNLKSVVISEDVTYIGEQAFQNCGSLTNIQLPSTLEKIDHWAFMGSGLQSIVIPDNVTFIGREAFHDCSALTSVTLPAKLETLNNDAFYNCTALRSISIPEGFKTLNSSTFRGCNGLTTVQLPSTLTTIGENVFRGCSSLRTITLPESVARIDAYAFLGCPSLESVYALPMNPPTVPTDASFAFTENINTATLYVKPEAKDAYNSNTMWAQFENVEIITQIPTGQPTFVFDGTTYQLSIVSQDANAAIYYTRDNTEPTEQSTRYTEPMAILQNDTVKAIAVSEGLAPSLVSEFRKNDFKVPTPTAEINDETFVVTVSCETPDIEGIPETKFYYCLTGNDWNLDYNDEAWKLVEGNTFELTDPLYLHVYAVRDGWIRSEQLRKDFTSYWLYNPQIDYNSSERTVTLSHQYSDHVSSQFYYTLDGSEPSKENGTLYTEPFVVDRNYKVRAVAVAYGHFNSDISEYEITDVSTIFLSNGIYYRLRDMTTNDEVEVCGVPEGIANYSGDITIPATVTRNNKVYTVTGIYNSAFSGSSIKSISLPEGLQVIRGHAFYSCQSLTEIEIPSTVEEIGSHAFYGCYGLNKMTLHDGLKTIREYAFAYCTQLTNVELPNTVTLIEHNTFYGCSGLTAITWPASVNTIEDNMFDGCEKLTNVTLPATLTTIKHAAFYNCRSLLKITLPESLTTIGYEAFRGCRALTSIVIPNGVKTIESSTFSYCESLVSVLLPAQLETIGSEAFYNCPNLASITLPATLKTIGSNAFGACGSLSSIYAQPSTAPEAVNGGGLESHYEVATLYVQPASKQAYQTAPYWSQFKTISEFTKIAAEQPAFVLQDYKLTLSTITAGGVIYYTRDGSNPTTQSLRYTEPLIFTQNDTVKAITVAEDMENSKIAEFRKNDFKVAQPQSTLDEETLQVTISCEIPEAEGMPETRIWYALSQSYSTPESDKYMLYDGEPIQLTNPSYVHMYAERDGWITSDRRYDNFYDNYRLDEPYLDWNSEQKLMTITQSNADAIYYTIDNSEPTKENGILYTGSFTLGRNLTVKAIAVKDKHFNSRVRTYIVTGLNNSFMVDGLAYRLADNTLEDVVEVTSGSETQETIVIPESVTYNDVTYPVARIGDNAFSGLYWSGKNVTKFVLPKTIKSIGNSAFYDNYRLKEIVLNEGLETIGENAFGYAYDLEEISIPSTVISIGQNAFNTNQEKAINIYCYAKTPQIEENTFGGRTTVATLNVYTSQLSDFQSADYWKDFTTIKTFDMPKAYRPDFKLDLAKYKLAITTPTEGATIYYTRDGSDPTTNSLVYTDSLIFTQNDTIRAMAAKNGMLNSIITEFKKSDFKVAAPVATIDTETFQVTINCETPDVEGMPETRIWYVIDQSYYNRSDGFTLYDGEPIQMTEPGYIHMYAERDGWIMSDQRYDDFYNNYRLTTPSINWDSETKKFTLTHDDNEVAFYYTLDGSEPTKENGILYTEPVTLVRNLIIKAIATKDAHFNSAVREYTVTGVDSRFLYNGLAYRLVDNTTEDVVELTSGGNVSGKVTIPETVEDLNGKKFTVVRIGDSAFSGENDITEVVLPETISSIGEYAFNECRELTNINLPDALTDMGRSAFYRTNLKEIVVPGGLKKLPDAAFMDNFNTKSVIIKPGVEEIDHAAFAYCGMQSLELPATLKKIGFVAFQNCASLVSVSIPDAVVELDNSAFYECSKLATVRLSASLARLGSGAFSGCSSLALIVLPESLKKIEDNAFANCVSLNHVYSQAANPPTIETGSSPFTDVVEHATLYVKPQSEAIYSQTPNWGAFSKIETFENLPCEKPVFAYDNYRLTISSETEGVNIYYTLDGTEPTTSSLLYKEPVAIAKNDTILAMAIGENWGRSLTSEWKKNDLQVTAPQASIDDDFTVTITCEEPEIDGVPPTRIYYSLNRSNYSASDWTLYTEPLKLTVANYLHVRAERDGWLNSTQSDFNYYTNYYLEKPTISPYYTSISYMPADSTITLSHENADAELYYTLDGSDPNEKGILYKAPFNPGRNVTVTAIAKCAGHINSDPEQREYKWFTVATPQIAFEGKICTMTSKTEGVTLYYTTDNSQPTVESMLYKEPIALPAQQTEIKVIAMREDWNTSNVATRTYYPGGNTCEAPVIARVVGTDSIQISTRTAGTTIYYTSNGLNPTTNDSVYKKPFVLEQNGTLKAIATSPIYYDSEVASAEVNWFKAPQPVISVVDKVVTISCENDDATIHYTLDGSDPTEENTVYRDPLTMTGSCTIKAVAVQENMNNSTIAKLEYRSSEHLCGTPEFTRDGNFVVISALPEENTSIYYTIDESTPTTKSEPYTQPVEVAENVTIKAIATNPKLFQSEVGTYEVNWFKTEAPEIVFNGVNATITCVTPGAAIYYTIDGTTPTVESPRYSKPVKLTASCTVKAIAIRENFKASNVSTSVFDRSEYMAETPQFQRIDNTVMILTSDVEGTVIYYTLDGAEPTVASEVYKEPIPVTGNCTLKAMVTQPDLFASEIAEYEVNWFKVEAPVIAFDGTITNITCETPNAKIFYTLDGTTPTEESLRYQQSFTMTNSGTIKAIAMKDNYYSSSVVSVAFDKAEHTAANPLFQVVDSVLTITSESMEGTTIYYTTDGTEPSSVSNVYTEPFKLTGNVTIKAIAMNPKLFSSEVTTLEVNWFSVETPEIIFDGIMAVVNCATPNSRIYYTVDGTTPTEESLKYTGQFAMTSTCTVKAIAMRTGYNSSPIASVAFNKDENTIAKPLFQRTENTIAISASPAEGTVIYYTTDGTEPTATSDVYSEPIQMEGNCTLKALATNPKMFQSEIGTYDVNWFKVEAPEVVFDGIFVTMSTTTPNARIYYTLDGSAPTEESLRYTGMLTMSESCTLKAIGIKENYYSSSIVTNMFDKASNTVADPQFKRNGNIITLTTSTTTEGTAIYYTVDGSWPTEESTVYAEPIQVEGNCELQAMALNDKLYPSEVVTYDVDWFKVATPVVTLNGNVVTMSCSTSDATIYYAYDEEPTNKSLIYTEPITIVDNRSIYAIAMRQNYHDSEAAVIEPNMFICVEPTFAYNGRYLQIETGEGMTIHYTTDGSKPTEDSEVCDGQVEITEPCTVRAIAMRRDFRDSPEASYTVSYVYTGEDASQTEAGHLADMFQWVGGADNVENLPVSGKINDADLAFIRSLKSLRHLDLTDAVYEGSKLPDEAFANMPLLTFQSPKQLSAVGNHLFSGCDQLAAIVWNANIAIPETVTEDVKGNANFLLYVNSRIHVPSSYTGNIISGGQATSITLTDAGSGNFCCPQRFFTNRISYTHTYSQTTESGVTCGWETLALPFDVQSITHERRGAMAPFSAQEDYSLYKPFWLYELQETGFSDATEVKAYTPYIISMPNNPNYADDFILAGKVTFSAADTYIEVDTAMVTMKGSVRFAPAMQRQEKSSTVLAINLEDCTVDGTFYRSGSAFLPNLRTVNPFEAYALVGASVPKIPLVDMEWGYVTDMRNAQMSELEAIGRKGGVYDLLGRKLSNDSSNLKNDGGKMKRVYIINGKKTVVE